MPHLFCCCCCWPLWECDSSPVHHHNTTVHVRFHVSAEVFPQPVILAVQLHRAMSNVCLMGVGEASITLIVAHWVNFSYLENPSFLKCCECGGYDGRLRGKTKGWLASNTALRSGTTFMGFSDGADGHLKFGWRSLFESGGITFSVFIWGRRYVYYLKQSVLRFTMESVRYSVLYVFHRQCRIADKDAIFRQVATSEGCIPQS